MVQGVSVPSRLDVKEPTQLPVTTFCSNVASSRLPETEAAEVCAPLLKSEHIIVLPLGGAGEGGVRRSRWSKVIEYFGCTTSATTDSVWSCRWNQQATTENIVRSQ